MSVLTDTLTKAGYELISIGSEVFPCTIMHDGEPIGFLKQDGAVSLLPEYEQSRGELESVAAYAQEFKDLEQSEQGLVMTRYRDTFLTVDYSLDTHEPVYHIYRNQENGEPQRLETTADRDAAVSYFMGLSGLARRQTAEPQKDTPQPKERAVKPKQQKYSITNPDGKEVGYIGKNGMAVMYGGKPAHAQPPQPSFFDKLREKLAEIGLAIRVHFRRGGTHYAIHDKAHDIAYISPDRKISYTSYATPEQTQKIDALDAEIMAERAAPAQEQAAPSQEQEKEQTVQLQTPPVQEAVQHDAPSVPSEETISEVAQSIQQPVQEQEIDAADLMQAVAVPNSPAQEAPEQEAVQETQQPAPAVQETAQENSAPAAPAQESKDDQQKQARETALMAAPDEEMRNTREMVLHDFERGKEEMKLLGTFNTEADERKKDAFIKLYGTEDETKFLADLGAGKYDKPDLLTSLDRIALQNILFDRKTDDVSQEKGEKNHAIG